MPDRARRPAISVPVYFPPTLYEWLVLRKARGHGSLTQQIVRYCEEGRIRDELADAAAEMRTDPDALGKIQARIRREERDTE
jgi:hypothetical protein